MKFTHFILRNVVPEWVKLYLNFKLLKNYLTISRLIKELLVVAKKTKSTREYKIMKHRIMDNTQFMTKLKNDNQEFIKNFTDEVEKVENFSFMKYNDLRQKMLRIQQQIKTMRYIKEELENSRKYLKRSRNLIQVFVEKGPQNTRPTMAQIERDEQKLNQNSDILLETFYRLFNETLLFQSYIEVNNEAVRKILKKYKKQMIKGVRNQRDEKKHFGELLKKIDFKYMDSKLKQILLEIEELMVHNFYQKSPKECRVKLRKYHENKKTRISHVFAFGFFAGYILVFSLILIFLRFEGYIDPDSSAVFNKVFPCFRGMILFLTYYWFITLDVYLWNYFKINYKLYLGFNHHFSTTTEMIKRVSLLSTIFVLVFIIYIMQKEGFSMLANQIQFFDPQYLPIIIWAVVFLYLFVPTQKSFNGQGRMWMYRMGYGALIGHYTKYESRYTFFTDQFVSMVTPLRDVDYTFCYYYSLFRYNAEPDGECNYSYRISALLPSLIPYSMKCLQYITRARDKGKFWRTDEMWNFFKTLLAVQVGWLSFVSKQYAMARYVWIPVAITSSLWQYWWDLKMDWLFFEPNARHKFLRDDLGFNSPSIYYIIGVANFFLRATWALSISPDMYIHFGVNSQLFTLLVGFLEMTRRLLNNFLKIEKEHILNLNKLQTVMDYKYPFDQKILTVAQEQYQEDEGEEIKSQWSVSTLNRDSYLQEFVGKAVSGQTIQTVSSQAQHKSVDSILIKENSEEIDQLPNYVPMPSYVPINLSTSRVVLDRSDLKELNRSSVKRDTDDFTQQQFRLTNIIAKQTRMTKEKKVSQEEDMHNVNMDVINLAKKQEKLQKNKIAKIHQENLQYKLEIDAMYQLYRMVKE